MDIVVNQQIHGFVVPAGLNSRYLAYAIKAQKQLMEASATSTTILYLNKTRCEILPLPLPPLAEQNRIVARVDQFMSLCDQLEAGLMRSQAESERLMEAVVGKMLTGGDSA